MPKTQKELTLRIQLTVIEQLGMKMYASLPPVLAELVANAWDANAKKVEITIPSGIITPDYEISVKDEGEGMTFQELNDAYLSVGRNRRIAEGREKLTSGRRIMGRKGIGKLSAFGIARILKVETVKDGLRNAFEMNLEDILKKTRAAKIGQYHPHIVARNQKTSEKNGTKISIKNLVRKSQIDLVDLRRSIARRFSVIGDEFEVRINGTLITPADRDLKSKVQYYWQIVPDPAVAVKPIDKRFQGFIDGKVAGDGIRDWIASGWIGTMEKPTVGSADSGITLMARGKLIHEPSFYEVTGGKEFAYAYMLGEINVEYFDDAEDLVATHRSNVVWESDEGQATKLWLKQIITKVSLDWSALRSSKTEKEIKEDPANAEWLSHLNEDERKVAGKIIRIVSAADTLESETRKELMGYVRQSFEYQVFREIATELEENPNSVNMLRMMRMWNVVEAKEILHIAEGRLKTIEQFDELVKTNAKEVPTIHEFLSDFPWILDPTWTQVEEEVTFSEMLKKEFPDEKLEQRNRRIDFMCFGIGNILNIYELKRPLHKLNDEDMVQLERYIYFVKAKLGSSNKSYAYPVGYIVVGDVEDSASLAARIAADRGNQMFVLKYSDLLRHAKKLHKEFADKLRKLDPTWKI